MSALSLLTSRAQTLNARVGAVTLVVGAFMTLVLSHTSMSLAPLRIITLAIAAFAVWSFSDEMGIRKPLNRAGFIFFCIAVTTKVQVSLGVDPHLIGRYLLLYSAFLLLAVLFWSVAFLHRQRELKVVGAVGLLAAAGPVLVIVVGHVVVGVGAVFGVGSLLEATYGAAPSDTSFVTLVERIFGVWAYVAAWLLWRGHIIGGISTAPSSA
ncbi:hypothetical protein [Gynuella sunshinyii]|uniref:Uncharacterized protein n=1 Tax=Gynuella sunshinyii YC6258 TaxID=1445510 RepID=A0A0C5VB47_9GAMM|nr:hypothetical protein [Gynuella sunshinyii]AJQ96570.1 hypothetical Protein YC6258_04538 [Gynuella sunshinyii YC6258]